jgi:hypothetical protein
MNLLHAGGSHTINAHSTVVEYQQYCFVFALPCVEKTLEYSLSLPPCSHQQIALSIDLTVT